MTRAHGRRCGIEAGPVARCVGALVATFLVTVGLGATVAAAATSAPREGAVVVVDPGNRSTPVTGGNSETTFALALPDGAACPGDSANDGYRIQSFLVPVVDDPGQLTYRSVAPEGENRISLYTVDTNPFVQQLTQMNGEPGRPGLIDTVPDMTFGIYAPTDLRPGPHRMGIACTLGKETVSYWDVEVELTRDTTDQPAQIRWAVAGSDASTADSGSNGPSGLLLAVIALVGLAVVVFAFTRLRRPEPSSNRSKELQ